MRHWSSSTARLFPPTVVHADGHEPITLASRFGRLTLSRQVCQHLDTQTHVMPGNAVLPPHHGIIITRGLQEWACLLPQELSFTSVARLLGWTIHEQQILADTTIRSLVRTHGQLIRQAEQREVAALLQRSDLATVALHLVPHDQPRRRVGWPAALNAAVETALATQQVRPPEGVSWADWERVLAARRVEGARPVEELRHLGPELAADQVLVTVDEVLTRKPEPHHFWELRTARVITADGYRERERRGGVLPGAPTSRGAVGTRGVPLSVANCRRRTPPSARSLPRPWPISPTKA